MLRLTLFLCAAMIAALMLLGEDRGQMRPGLAKAAAEGTLPVAGTPMVKAEAQPEAAPVAVADAPAARAAESKPQPDVQAVDAAIAEAAADPTAPEATAEAYVEPEREVVQAVEEPVFTLSALGNESVPGEDGAALDTAATGAPPSGDGTIWYVNATSVNVRAEPSTEAEVLGKLASGEAALLVAAVDGEWARIVIQGDGMEGYVALRYLSPEAP